MAKRTKHAPTPSTRAVVRALAAFGINQEHIAAKLSCSVKTLSRNYRKELDEALPDMIAKVAQSLYSRAIDPKSGMAGVKAAELILKARGGWRDNFQNIEHSGSDGSPMGGSTRVILELPINPRDLLPQITDRPAPLMIDATPVEDGVLIESE